MPFAHSRGLMKRTSKNESKPSPPSRETAMPLPPELLSPAGAPQRLSHLLLDPKKPAAVRARLLLDVLNNNPGGPAAQQALLTELFQQAGGRSPDDQLLQLMESYEQALTDLAHGPVRPATFIAPADGTLPDPQPRVHVITPDGGERYASLHPRVALADLRPGMTVYLYPKGVVVLGATPTPPRVGQQGTFLRRLEDSNLVEAAF